MATLKPTILYVLSISVTLATHAVSVRELDEQDLGPQKIGNAHFTGQFAFKFSLHRSALRLAMHTAQFL